MNDKPMHDKPMHDKPRCNLATITRKASRQVHVYEYMKVDSKPGELEYVFMQLCYVTYTYTLLLKVTVRALTRGLNC